MNHYYIAEELQSRDGGIIQLMTHSKNYHSAENFFEDAKQGFADAHGKGCRNYRALSKQVVLDLLVLDAVRRQTISRQTN